MFYACLFTKTRLQAQQQRIIAQQVMGGLQQHVNLANYSLPFALMLFLLAFVIFD